MPRLQQSFPEPRYFGVPLRDLTSGRVVRFSPQELADKKNPETFRRGLLNWANRRGLKAKTRFVDGALFFQVTGNLDAKTNGGGQQQ